MRVTLSESGFESMVDENCIFLLCDGMCEKKADAVPILKPKDKRKKHNNNTNDNVSKKWTHCSIWNCKPFGTRQVIGLLFFLLLLLIFFFIIISQRASSVDKKSTKSEHVCMVCPVYVYISFLVVFLHYTQDCFLLSPIHLVRAAICRTHWFSFTQHKRTVC